MIGRLLSAVFLGTLRFVFYMLVGMMVLIRGRRKTAAALVDNGYADNDTLWRRIQVLKVELMQKEQQLEAVKRVNGVYVGEQIPALRAELQDKDQLLEKFQTVDAKGKTDAVSASITCSVFGTLKTQPLPGKQPRMFGLLIKMCRAVLAGVSVEWQEIGPGMVKFLCTHLLSLVVKENS